MADRTDTVYLKADGNVEVDKTAVTVGDVFQIECAGALQKAKIKTIRLFRFRDGERPARNKKIMRKAVSALKAIEAIHGEFPKADVVCLGSPDVIVTYREPGSGGKLLHAVKTAGVAALTFAGAAFSIMAFNNDVDVTRLFGQVYELMTGTKEQGFTILELSYSLGLVAGILVFFNHFGKKRFSEDPTPIEVQMRTYEGEIQNALIETYSRKGKELDVDTADRPGNSGT